MSQFREPSSRVADLSAPLARETRSSARAHAKLSSATLRAALDALYAIGEGSVNSNEFARRGVECLPRLVGSELTTLSICNLDTGHRIVVSDQPGAISVRDLEVFDRYFFHHPLVREHGRNPCAVTKRRTSWTCSSE